MVIFRSGRPVKRREEDHLNFKLSISFLSSYSPLVDLLNEEKSSLLKLVE